MARIKIKDLPRNKRIKQEEMKQIKGGGGSGWMFGPCFPNIWPKIGIVAAAIAIPLAELRDDDDSS